MHSRQSKDNWTYPTWQGLLGDFGKPIVPLWWAEALPDVGFTTYFKKRGEHLVRTRKVRQEVIEPILATVGVTVNWERTLEGLGNNIENQRNDFLDASIGDPTHALNTKLIGSDLPLHIEYVEKFEKLGLGSSSLSEISGIPIQHFLDNSFKWIEVVDIAYMLNHGVGHIFGLLASHESNPSRSLEEAAKNAVDELWLRDGGSFDDQRMDGLRRRFGIGCEVETLDEIGKRIGVTRERVRQIEGRLTPFYAQRRWPIGDSIQRVIDEISKSNSSDVFDDLFDIGISDGSVDWNRPMFERLLLAYGQRELLESIKGIGEPLEIDSEFGRNFRKHRNPIGFVDLRTFVNDNGQLEDPDTVFRYVEQIYSNSWRSGNYALAADARGTQAQNAVEKQFAVCNEISGTELVEGIDRVSRNRKYGPLPPTPVVLDLLVKAGTIAEVKPGLFTGSGKEIEGELKKFLVEAIKNSPGGVANQPELFRQAVLEGFNTSSLVLYLTYDPMIRKFNNGLIRLAGSKPTQQAIEDARKAAELQTEKGSVSFLATNRGQINVLCILGTVNLNSGVLSPPTSLRDILDPEGYSILCCDDSNFDGQLKLSGSLWYGFQPLFNHIRHKHGIKDGEPLSFTLNNGEMKVTSW
jgi:hypothetical protein